MNLETLHAAVQHMGATALGVGFLAGLVSSFNPVALASIPVSMAYVTKARTARQSAIFGFVFILGMIAIQVCLGFIAGLSGNWIAELVGRQWGLLIGPILILLGMFWPGWLRLPLPSVARPAQRPTTLAGAFVLGAIFSVAICPICTPALVILLGASAALASPWRGAALLLMFSLGRAIPIALGAWAVGWLENLKVLARYQRAFEIAGAVTMIASGLYMLNAYFFWLPALAG